MAEERLLLTWGCPLLPQETPPIPEAYFSEAHLSEYSMVFLVGFLRFGEGTLQPMPRKLQNSGIP